MVSPAAFEAILRTPDRLLPRKRRTGSDGRRLADASTATTIWRAALGMFYDSPVAGKGPGTYQVYYAESPRPTIWRTDARSITTWAHCEYLEVLAETGLVGMVPFVIFLGLFVIRSV